MPLPNLLVTPLICPKLAFKSDLKALESDYRILQLATILSVFYVKSMKLEQVLVASLQVLMHNSSVVQDIYLSEIFYTKLFMIFSSHQNPPTTSLLVKRLSLQVFQVLLLLTLLILSKLLLLAFRLMGGSTAQIEEDTPVSLMLTIKLWHLLKAQHNSSRGDSLMLSKLLYLMSHSLDLMII